MKNLLKGRTAFFLMVLFVFGAAVPIHGQKDSAEIAKIRQIYTKTNDRIATAEKNFPESDIFFSELIVNKGGTPYPAVGIFKSVYCFYYTYGDREEDPYPNRLLKVIVKTDRSANREYAEYLFDKTGGLVFYFEKMNDEQGSEGRFYFSKGKIIRIQRGEKIGDTKSREEISATKAVLSQAAKIVQIFRNSID